MRRIDRYVLHEKLASGGMAAVYLGQMLGHAGFARTVAIKRLHPHVAETPGALAMFMDEARLSARVRHPNIVATLDVAQLESELLLVMEYVHGASLAFLERDASERMPLPIAIAIIVDALTGLQAAHDATDERGQPLSIVHRDVSPQNIIVGEDGMARVLDFGIAKAAVRLQTTREGQIKGKLRYMAPEQLLNRPACSKTDGYAAAVVLWELLTGRRLFDASNEGAIIAKVLEGVVIPPSRISPDVPPALEALVLRGLSRNPEDRFASCRDMALALRSAVAPAHCEEIREYVRQRAGDLLRERASRIAQIEMGGGSGSVDVPRAGMVTEGSSDSLTASASLAFVPPMGPIRESRLSRRSAALLSGIAAAIVGVSVSAAMSAGGWWPQKDAEARQPASQGTAPASATLSDMQLPKAAAAAAAAAPENNVVIAPTTPEGSAAPEATEGADAPKPVAKPRGAPAPARVRSSATLASPAVAHPELIRTMEPAHPACDSMVTVDANGIRRVKPECL